MNRYCMLAESIRKEFRARRFEPFYGGMYVTTARLLEHGLIESVVHEEVTELSVQDVVHLLNELQDSDSDFTPGYNCRYEVREGRPVRVETYTMYRFIRSALKSEGLL